MAILLEEGKTYLASVAEKELYFEDRDGISNTVIYVEIKVLQITESNADKRYYKIELRDSEGSAVHWLPKTVFFPDKGWFCPEINRFSHIEIIKEL